MKCTHWLISAGMLVLTMVKAARAAEVYVNAANVSGTELGTRGWSPFRTVQAAIDSAGAGDTIRVAAGAYVQNLRIQSKPLILEGGYSSAWVRDLSKNTTTLSGAGGNAVINLIEADVTIDGFRITGGRGSTEELPYGYHGGGIYCRDGSPTISNNIIEGNDLRSGAPPFDSNRGGGVYVSNTATMTILNNLIRGNFAGRGAGVFVVGQEALIQGNTIENNTAVGDHGGGLFIAVVKAKVTQNIIRGNEIGRDLTYGWGGGLIVAGKGNFAELSFNSVSQNFAAAYGAGEFIDEGAQANIHHELIYRNVSKAGCEAVSAISVDGGESGGSEATITYCTVANNVCENSTRGNGLQVEDKSVVNVTNCIFWNNGGDDFSTDGTAPLKVTYTDSQESFTGTGNISANPLFVNEAADDYHLAAGSPCIDAGDPATPFTSGPADGGSRADMGRYGNPSYTPPSNASSGSNGSNDGSNGSNTDGTGGDGNNQGTDAGGMSAGLCPASSAMLISMSLIGVRMAQRRRLDLPRRG